MPKRLTPQEKKALSLAKDRRNAYGENDKASRKNIPRAKARSQRENRRKSSEVERDWITLNESDADVTESTLLNRKLQKPKWKKMPDEPLGRFIEDRFRWRKLREGRKKRSRTKQSLK